jgi:fucose 4-O-acetylase-like acetyltransferase
MKPQYLNGALGIAITVVVFGHVLNTIADAGFLQDGRVTYVLMALRYTASTLAFPLFFFVFGLQATASLRRSRLGFLSETFVGLAWPYALWSLLQLFVTWVVARYAGHPFPLGQFERIAWAPVGQFGFLYALCLCQLVACAATLPEIDDTGRTATRVNRILIAGLVIACAALATMTEWGLVTTTFRGLVFYLSGVLAARNLDGWVERYAKPIPMAGAAMVFAAAIVAGRHSGNYRDLEGLPASFAGIAMMLPVAQWLTSRHRARWLTALGAAWKPVYLLHVLASSAVWVALLRLGVAQPVVHVVAGTVVGIALPLLAYVLAKRLRVARFAGFLQADDARPRQSSADRSRDRPQSETRFAGVRE